MANLIRRFRGLGIAVAVLALSAGVVFAGAPRTSPVSHRQPAAEEPTGSAETPTASESDEDSPEASESDEADSPEASESEEADSPEPSETDAAESPEASGEAQDAHGLLVSTAAQMETPAGFRNHGAFVSCVARMTGVTLATIDWTTVTPESCGLTTTTANPKADAGKAKGAAGRAKGHAKGAAGKAHAHHGG
jgi:hypothetical protein